jgi:hypothetical protein
MRDGPDRRRGNNAGGKGLSPPAVVESQSGHAHERTAGRMTQRVARLAEAIAWREASKLASEVAGTPERPISGLNGSRGTT